MAVSGNGMQVVQVLNNHAYQLDEKLLEAVLLKPEIKELPVVVVSVAGAYRGGKSFLLNFFIRYLSASLESRADGSWLGADSAPLVGFNWRGGSTRNTTGILLWSEPFINTLPSGEKVAVLLMDTQGNFDSRSTVRDNSTIFALSTLISSVQIYNISMNIQEDDLQHLQLFTMYGKMVQEKDQGGKAFQTLEFLIRDWPYFYDYAYGEEGGRGLLQERLEITPDMPKELKELRTHIRSSFEKVTCFLMPHPGFKVQNPAFKGNMSDIDPEFKSNLKTLVSSLLSTENLTPKLINHQKVKAGELYNYFKAYMNLFNSDEILSPRSIMQATIEASLLTSMNAARETYEKGMAAELGLEGKYTESKPALAPIDLQDVHKKYLAAAKKVFTEKRSMATDAEISKCLKKINTELEARLPLFEQINLAKLQKIINAAEAIYDLLFLNIDKNQPLCLHPTDLEEVHREAVKHVMKAYDGHVKKISQKPDEKRAELLQTTESRLVEKRVTNDKNNKDVIKDIHTEYWRFMETKSLNPPIPDREFSAAHQEGLNSALAKFHAKRNRPFSSPNDIYKDELTKTINDTFWRLRKLNLRNIEQENARREQVRQIIEQKRIEAEQRQAKEEQEKRAMEINISRLATEKAQIEQEKKKVELELERARRRSSSSGPCTIL